MYGTKIQAAGREIFAKTMIVARIVSQRNTISISAPPGLCRPKKIIDQSVFRMSWPIKILSAILISLRSSPFLQTRNAAMPMMNLFYHNFILSSSIKLYYFDAMKILVVEDELKLNENLVEPSLHFLHGCFLILLHS
ncbi:MAG: hypothetical protein UT30_C0013G0012 [Candidatus Uhrbacteria bacterium GW2011_GWF2_39_13]|uniref:Uncharacterized protein n=1 Tax=Candidatus Uhrbacteria bacterium GW2011_GWF2_39_13 TaxID=1618995 RepID=A0A0G0MUD6_9BACT|nr:MAG: hypothetical protein UT30_C0013G0012 [Candidatus Uhrbacteria bacterium GW2011_GWF2_39_13]